MLEGEGLMLEGEGLMLEREGLVLEGEGLMLERELVNLSEQAVILPRLEVLPRLSANSHSAARSSVVDRIPSSRRRRPLRV
jgi:hypothetical protein